MSWFITATDTGVGKTLITGGLAYALRQRRYDVGCWKPLQSGELLHDPTGDAWRLKALGDLPDPVEQICCHAFFEPLAPRLAAERAGAFLNRRDLLAHYAAARKTHQHLLCEGAGGLAVPLTADTTVAELAAELGLPLLIIARAGLGTVNHTVLTVSYAQSLGLHVAGVILSGAGRHGHDLAEAHNPAYIEEYAGVPVLGSVPWLGDAPTLEQVRAATDPLANYITL
ncbi:dethiobiotin synthase [Tumebacillus avium]|uniref:ATP-dependent dethiobiotin synthetase BioD n=1 Tax=Tumebacillus avium TaxID=1903704 RepID=A0A1Y0II93_9BACL|nr:dethiobiotin synthase [Tumebacillus avium]ARU59789.1 dethiobiotin synthase [Tumebacillus avium]